MIKFSDVERVYDKLQDSKSKKIFDMWFSYALEKSDFYDFYKLVKGEDLRCYEYERFFEKDKKPVAIFGAGRVGNYTYELLTDCGYKVMAVADSHYSKEKANCIEKMGGVLITVGELCKHIGEWRVAISCSDLYRQQIMDELLRMGFPYEDIFYPPYAIIRGWCGFQYFDYFSPKEKEIFVDGGVLNGNTTRDFVYWSKDHYGGAYLFEANPLCIEAIEKTMEDNKIKNYKIINKGMSDRREKVNFDGTIGGGARIIENGGMTIECNSLDNELKGEPVTLIKMDIEGAEGKALDGCRETIIKYKPRLAISIYHKKDDFYKIPLQILDIEEDYKFVMRHYCSVAHETVLYGWVD